MTPIPAERQLVWFALMVMAIAVAAGVMEPALAMFHTIPYGYNEGWNAYWADVALRGGSLYPAPASSIANNYPPLSFFVVGAAGRLLGDNIFAGRLIALLSLLVVAADIYLWLRITGSTRGIALAGAALFTAAFVIWAPDYIAADDPQLLAHAIMLTGLLVLWRGQFSHAAIIGASVLMLLAGFTKHLLIPLPLATTLWLALRSRRGLWTWIVASSVTALLFCAAASVAFGPFFSADLLFGREYSVRHAIRMTREAITLCLPALILTAVIVAHAWRSRKTEQSGGRAGFAMVYLAVAGMIGALASGGAGVGANAFFDFLLASSICSALGLEALQSMVPRWRLAWQPRVAAFGALGLLALPLTIHALEQIPTEIEDLRRLDAREAEALQDIHFIREIGQDHAACETLSLCYWAQSSFEVDFFNYGEILKRKVLPESSCEAVFLAPRIRLVQIEKFKGQPVSFRLPMACNDLIHRHYKPIRDSEFGVLLVRERG